MHQRSLALRSKTDYRSVSKERSQITKRMKSDRIEVIARRSPNYGPRRSEPIDILLLHYTGMQTGAEALARLTDADAAVSAHYLIDEDGTTYELVDESKRAWHAGQSFWAGETDINSRSIGIEIVNPGHEFGYRPFPDAQMAALTGLALSILERHPIPPWRILGHSDVAPGRRQDPGELFDWPRLAAVGIGIWPPVPQVASTDARDVLGDLGQFGYRVTVDNIDDEANRDAIVAFQRHFRPARTDGRIDAETAALARAVIGMMG